MKRVCIIIPAYNEEDVISDVLKKSLRNFKKSPHKIDIVVIDDNSTDQTAKKARQTEVTVINHILNTGAGGATATGLEYAKQNDYDIAATMDADGQHAPEDVLKGIDHLLEQNVDLLIGSRMLDTKGMPKSRIIGNKGLSLITWMLFGISSTDSQSGLRVFSRRAIESLRWETTSYEFCSEMLWRAKQAKLKVADYPVKAIYTNYSRKTGQSSWNAVNILKQLFKMKFLEIFG